MNKGLTLLRMGLGMTMLWSHGIPKLQKFSVIAPHFPDPLGLGSTLSLGLVIGAECVCSLLLIMGLGVRLVVIPLIITMGVAFFIFHSADPFAKKELAFLYLTGFLTILIGGGGAYKVTLKGVLPDKPWINWAFDR